jgi:hypothetical protein
MPTQTVEKTAREPRRGHQVCRMTKRNVLECMQMHVPELESLGIRTFRQLSGLIQEKEDAGFQLPEVNPVPPPERAVRVIHGGHTVKVPKPVVVVDTRVSVAL